MHMNNKSISQSEDQTHFSYSPPMLKSLLEMVLDLFRTPRNFKERILTKLEPLKAPYRKTP